MSGIIVPHDRVDKYARGYCYNPECIEPGVDRYEFKVEHDRFCCPKCGANKGPLVGLLVLTHWIARDPKGPIEGEGGLRYKLACDTKRAYLATFTNMEAATPVLEIVNCPGCLKVAQEQRLIQTHPLLIGG